MINKLKIYKIYYCYVTYFLKIISYLIQSSYHIWYNFPVNKKTSYIKILKFYITFLNQKQNKYTPNIRPMYISEDSIFTKFDFIFDKIVKRDDFDKYLTYKTKIWPIKGENFIYEGLVSGKVPISLLFFSDVGNYV